MKKIGIATAVAVSAFLLMGMSACHGRTTDNVEPTGDTIEVVIDTVAVDSIL